MSKINSIIIDAMTVEMSKIDSIIDWLSKGLQLIFWLSIYCINDASALIINDYIFSLFFLILWFMARMTPFENECNKIGYIPTVNKYVILYTIFIGGENTDCKRPYTVFHINLLGSHKPNHYLYMYYIYTSNDCVCKNLIGLCEW